MALSACGQTEAWDKEVYPEKDRVDNRAGALSALGWTTRSPRLELLWTDRAVP